MKDKGQASRKRRLKEGLCVGCGLIPPEKDRLNCIFCCMKRSRLMTETRAKKLADGLCVRCGNKKCVRGIKMCGECSTRSATKCLRNRTAYKEQIFDHYGRECSCCGENDLRFLTIDHINSDGNIHRKVVTTASLPGWIVNQGFPKDFQILCYNCNLGKAKNGGVCPHKDKQS